MFNRNKKFFKKKPKPQTADEKLKESKEIMKDLEKIDLPLGCNTILSVNGYSIPKNGVPAHVISKVRRDLTIEPFVDRPEFGTNVIPIKIFEESEKRVYMPRFYGISTFGLPKEDKLTNNDKMIKDLPGMTFNPNITLRENQVPVVEKMVSHIKTNFGGTLSIYCGGGKTLMALNIASRFRLKTAVICHTTDLMYQWKEEIKKALPNAKIGIIQQDNCIMKDRDIIIVSLKTLSLKDFPVGIFDEIGLTIWDEIHLMVTQLFSKGFMKMITPYSLGLTATPFRKDKCERIFYNFIGPIIHYEKRAPNNTVRVDCVVYKAQNMKIEKNFKGDMLYTTTVVNVCYSEERIKFIADIAAKIVSQIGRKLLILSEYVQHLKDLKEAIEKATKERQKKNLVARPIKCGLYIGEMKNEERVVSRECDVILGTYKIASVGMDIPDLNTLILASPRKDIEQSVGRIFRKNGNLHPRIIDIIDDHSIFVSQGRVRKEFYKQYDYTIIQSKVDWTGKVSSQRIIHDVTKMKSAKKPKTVESLMSEEKSNDFGSKGGDSEDEISDCEDDEIKLGVNGSMPILHEQDE